MTPSLPSSKLREDLLDLLWQQWGLLGVAGHGNREPDWIVDIEALVLVTTSLGRTEPRMFDEMLDWLWANAQCVNVQRLRNIRKKFPLGDARALAAIAEWLSTRTTLSKWKPLATVMLESKSSPEPFFAVQEGETQAMYGELDPVFLKHGYARGPIERREMSRPPNPRRAAALSWKLRSLFGVQARCEFIQWLLTHDSGHPAEIARATYYFSRTVEDTLRELAGSGLVHSTQSGREKKYWLTPDDWRFLRTWLKPAGFPRWIDWPRFFHVQERLGAILGNPQLSPMLQASELRREFEELAQILVDGDLFQAFAASRNHTGLEFTTALIRDIEGLYAGL
jgi:hypothetical protein